MFPLFVTEMEQHSNSNSYDEVVLSTPVRERAVLVSSRINSVRVAKRFARMTHGITKKQSLPRSSCKGRVIQSPMGIQTTCSQARFGFSTRGGLTEDGRVFGSLKQEMGFLHTIILENQEFLQAKILEIEKSQQQLMGFLQSFRVEVLARQNSNGVEHVVPKLRSVSNKLCSIAKIQNSTISELRTSTNKINAIAKIQTSGISELRTSTNKLNAMITYRWPKNTDGQSSIVKGGGID